MKRVSSHIVLSSILICSSICVAQKKSEEKSIRLLPANDPCASVMFVDGCGIALYQGKVIKVLDGQTIEMFLGQGLLLKSSNSKSEKAEGVEKVRLRLAGISAPALTEKFGKESKRNLEKLLLNRTVEVTAFCHYIDGTRGWRAAVTFETLDIGLEQIKAGLARYVGSVVDVQEYRRCHYELAEKKAKADSAGIWQQVAK